ncbi:MAG TPA: glycosyltransferase family 2 protein [Pseudogracilibacillus sp.]|nr:glycosyltransferase family 2 protein [Pseudogracilibacillus sp.]
MNRDLITRAEKILNDKNTEIINKPKNSKIGLFKEKRDITIITASYNAEEFIERTIGSVINQTYPFEKIELIIVDDKSTDSTKEILISYAQKYKNITVVFLNENTGTAGMPRNIGLELHSTEKVMFLDADDWFHEAAVEKMIRKMDENNDDFVIGQTIKVNEAGENIHAEFMSYKERNHISPTEMPYLYYHMGPPSKLMKSSIIMENSIRFPEYKFGEDKSFFFDVLDKCKSLSVIKEPIYYVNRFKSNNESLTQVMTALDKRKIDLEILKRVYDQNLPIEKEKILMKRLVEYDLLKTCDSFVFIRSNEKQEYINIIKEALDILSARNYDIIEEFDTPLYKAGARLIERENYNDFIQLFTWYKLDQYKNILIKNDLPYYDVQVFDDSHEFKHISVPLYARAINSYIENKNIFQEIEIYGELKGTVDKLVIRDRKSATNELEVDIEIEGNNGIFNVSIEELDSLNTSLFTMFLRYDGHKLLNIKHQVETTLPTENRNMIFYTTKANNLGLAIRDKK